MLGTAAAAVTQLPGPFVHADEPITLRYAGTGVNAFKELADKCKEDTGIIIQYTTLTSDDVVKRAVTQPTSFDMLDSEYWMLKKIVPSGNLRGMDTKKIKLYDKIVPIFTKGELPDGAKTSRIGTARSRSATSTGGESPRVRRRADRIHDADPDGLQRRHAGHPPRPDRRADRELGAACSTRSSRARPRS